MRETMTFTRNEKQGWEWVGGVTLDGQTVWYTLEIDGRCLGGLAAKAFHNKTKRTKIGPVTVKILKKK